MTRAAADFVALQTGRSGLRLVAAHSDHSFPRHSHDEFGIGVIMAGGQVSHSGRGQVEAGAGDVITVNPGEVHDGMPLRGQQRAWRMLYLEPRLLTALREGCDPAAQGEFEFEKPVFADHATLRTQVLSAFSTLAGPDRATPASLEDILLPLIASLAARRQDAPLRGVQARLARVRDMLDSEVAAHDLQALALEADMSRFQLLRAFSAWTGLTPHAYAMQKRADRARRLISTGDILAHVAAETGYADQSHMTRDFRRRFGLTPASFAPRT